MDTIKVHRRSKISSTEFLYFFEGVFENKEFSTMGIRCINGTFHFWSRSVPSLKDAKSYIMQWLRAGNKLYRDTL